MKKIIYFSAKHPVSVFMLYLAIILTSVLCCISINLDYLPAIKCRNLTVSTKYQGISASEIEEMVTIPIEEAFSALKGLKKMESVSRDSHSIISIELKWGTDADMALAESREIIDTCYAVLPSGCEKPEVTENIKEKNTMTIAVIPENANLEYVRDACENEIKPFLQKINGISSIKISGGRKEEIHVLADKNFLEGKNITLQEVSDTIAQANFEFPAGIIQTEKNEFSVKTSGLYTSISDIQETPLKYDDKGILYLKDLAEIKKSFGPINSFFLSNGKECVEIAIKKRIDASPIRISKEIKKELENLSKIYGKWFSFQITQDNSVHLLKSFRQLFISGFFSITATIMASFFFLNSKKFSMIMGLIIPVSALFSILILKITGHNLNVISLAGIATGIGMVIDCSAVVLDNLQSCAAHSDFTTDKKQAVANSVYEICPSNTGSCITTIIVFIPVFFMKGLTGELFSSMAISIISAIFISWIFSFTLIPAAFMFFSSEKTSEKTERKLIVSARMKYYGLLGKCFENKFITFAILALTLCAGVVSLKLQHFSILPQTAPSQVKADITFQNGTPINELKETAIKLYKQITQSDLLNGKIQSINFSGGIEDDNLTLLENPNTRKEMLHIEFTLTNASLKTKEEIENFLENSGYQAEVYANDSLLSDIFTPLDLNFVFTAKNRTELNEKIKKVAGNLENHKLIPNSCSAEYVFTPDRISSSRFSISAMYSASIAKNALEGIESCNFYKNGKKIPIIVKFPEKTIKSVNDLENLKVKIEGDSIPLKTIGFFSTEIKEKILYRYNRKAARIFIVEDQKKKIGNEKINIFDSFDCINLKDEAIKELWGDSTLLLAVVFMLLYLVLGAQFESFLIPLLLLCSLPPAMSGALFFLTVFEKKADVNTIIAMIILFGTVINNSIILYEKCIADKAFSEKTIIKSCNKKLKALLFTNSTTIFSLIPFAIDPFNTSAQSSVAITIAGGMIFSLLVSIFIVPKLLFPVLRRKHPICNCKNNY